MAQQEIQLLIIIFSGMFLLLIGVVVFLVVFVQKRKVKYLIEKERASASYAQGLLTSRIETVEQTLQNISWELHDNIGQLLSVAALQLKMQKQQQPNNNFIELQETQNIIDDCLNQVRTLSKSLNPEMLSKNGLLESLEIELSRIKRLGILDYKIECATKLALNKDQEIILFRMLQEFISNTVKHGQAKNIILKISDSYDKLKIDIQDDGIGFDKKTVNKGNGQLNLESRAKLLGGEFSLSSEKKKGVKMLILIPNSYEKESHNH